ncbi:MAG: hypothetical protein ABI721_01545 [Candidatus Dojkabacteria bacterium]
MNQYRLPNNWDEHKFEYFDGERDVYLVSNDPSVSHYAYEKLTENYKYNDGIVLAVCGGMDSAFNLFAATKSDVGKDERVLILADTNNVTIDSFAPYRLDLIAKFEDPLEYIIHAFPFDPIILEIMKVTKRNSYNSKIAGLYRRLDSFTPNIDESTIKIGIDALDYPEEIKIKILNIIFNSDMVRRNTDGDIVGSVKGNITYPLTQFILHIDDVNWLQEENYKIIRTAILEGRVKLVRMPIQFMPKYRKDNSMGLGNKPIRSIMLSNVPQYLNESELDNLIQGLEDYNSHSEAPESNLLVNGFTFPDAMEVYISLFHSADYAKYREQLLMQNWMFGKPSAMDDVTEA